MKKLLFLMMMLMGVINTSAQEKKEIQKNDSLQYKFEKLQHDYDFLSCEYKLNKIILELNIYINNIKISVNTLSMNLYHGDYDEKIYRMNKELYESCKKNLEEKEKLTYWTKWNVKQIMEKANFYEMEINVLKSNMNLLDSTLITAKKSLEYYKGVLDFYRDYR